MTSKNRNIPNIRTTGTGRIMNKKVNSILYSYYHAVQIMATETKSVSIQVPLSNPSITLLKILLNLRWRTIQSLYFTVICRQRLILSVCPYSLNKPPNISWAKEHFGNLSKRRLDSTTYLLQRDPTPILPLSEASNRVCDSYAAARLASTTTTSNRAG